MARTSNITFGQVAQIADAMKAAGNRPTARAVRERIGSGSMGTIHKLLQQWQGKGSEADEETEAAELPNHIQSALMDFIGTEIATACEPLNEELHQAKADLEEIALDNERLNRAYDQQCGDVERLISDLANAKGQLMTIKDEFAEVKTEKERLQSVVNEQLREIDNLLRQRELFAALPHELSMLKQAHDDLNVDFAKANTERAVLSAQLNAAAERADDLAARLANAEKRNATQEVELKTASTTAQSATAELSAIARELAEIKNNGATPKVIKSAAKKTAVKKPINQELAV